MLRGLIHFGVVGLGNNHDLYTLMKSGMVTHVVKATVRMFPMKLLSAGENPCMSGKKYFITSITLG